MRNAKFVPFLLCLVMIMTTGCFYDQTEHCYSTIRFSYLGDSGDEGEFAKNISKLDLYVFDENHRIVRDFGPYTLSDTELKAKEARLLLPPGKNYRVVCVGNAGDNTSVHELTTGTYADTKLYHPATLEQRHNLVKSHDHLYHGTASFLIPEAGQVTKAVELKAAHVDFSVTVTGYAEYATSRAVEGSGLVVEHRGLPAWTDFDNKHSKHSDHAELLRESMSHFPDGVIGGESNESYIHDYNVMRSLSGSTIHLTDSNGNEITQEGVLPIDVDRYIEDIFTPKAGSPYDSDGELLQEAPIAIEIEFKNVGFVVKIPQWAIKDTTPGYN